MRKNSEKEISTTLIDRLLMDFIPIESLAMDMLDIVYTKPKWNKYCSNE